MITRLIIGNFKAIQEPVEIDLRPVTLLFGPNAAGKSSILHALHYALETLESRSLDTHETRLGRSYVNLGGFANFVHGRDVSQRVTIGFEQQWQGSIDGFSSADGQLSFTAGGAFAESLRSGIHAHRILWQIGIDPKTANLLVLNSTIEINAEPFASIDFSARANASGPVVRLNLRHPVLAPSARDLSAPRMARGESLIKKIGLPAKVSAGWASFSVSYESGVMRIGPDDALPRPGTRIRLTKPFDEGTVASAALRARAQLEDILNTMITEPIAVLHNELAMTLHVGPLRTVPGREGNFTRMPENSFNSWRDAGDWYDGRAAWQFPTRDSALAGEVEDYIDWVNTFLHQNDLIDSGFKLQVTRLRYFKDDRERIGSIKLQNEMAPGDEPKRPAPELDAFVKLFDPADGSLQNLTKPQLLARIRQIAQAAGELPSSDLLVLRDDRRALTLTFHDVGVGISQVVPVLIAIFYPYHHPIRMIEQPELHLHPKAQVALGDALIVASVCHAWRQRFIIETHSEHLLLRLLRRIRETSSNQLSEDNIRRLQPDQISIVYVEPSPGGAKVRRLRVDDRGEFIDRWPQGFFEERAEELFS